MNILVVCATDNSIKNRTVEKENMKILRKLFPDLAEVNYYYNNIISPEESRVDRSEGLTAGENACLTNLFESDNIIEEINKCYKNIKFNVIILEHCYRTLNRTKAFKNFSKILDKTKKCCIIIDSYEDVKRERIEMIEEVIRLLESSAGKKEVVDNTMIDYTDYDLNAYYDGFWGDNKLIRHKKGTGIKGATRDMLLAHKLMDPLDFFREGVNLTTFDDEPIISIAHLNLYLERIGFQSFILYDKIIIHPSKRV